LRAILRDAASGKWRLFERPRELVVASAVADVIPALRRIEAECGKGRYAAGFIAYEAAPAFDPALRVQADGVFPLLWFGLYDSFHDLPDDAVAQGFTQSVAQGFNPVPLPEIPERWTPSIDREQYTAAFNALQELIRGGETYQVNFTYRLIAHLPSSPWALFQHLVSAQATAYGGYIHAGEWVVCSASPEMFFEKRGTALVSKPMKGTAARGLWYEQDLEQAERLRSSEKERAENVMIVDMVRNDLGRIARAGSVRVPALFEVERYPTVWQMTSTVTAETDASLTEVMAALFPPASVTGAPKAGTMQIIAGAECSPRRIYTGTIGFVDPHGRAQFNVAIRTALINRKTEVAEYGIGGGIVADSNAPQERAEAELKAKVLGTRRPYFDLLETMLWEAEEGYPLLEFHLERLRQTAEYFGFNLDVTEVRERLESFARLKLRPTETSRPAVKHRVRMLVSKTGAADVTATPLAPEALGFDDVQLAAEPIDSNDPFLYHKTTNRRVYESACASRPGAADVLLFNDRGEVTESTIANLVVEIDGSLVTPPVRCGLLPGTARARLLRQGKARESVISLDELARASRVFLINSVRGMHEISRVSQLTDLSARVPPCKRASDTPSTNSQ
jgi:para-aminobenzoate synthetase/4-amino-4-deoxychorismate lyase